MGEGEVERHRGDDRSREKPLVASLSDAGSWVK